MRVMTSSTSGMITVRSATEVSLVSSSVAVVPPTFAPRSPVPPRISRTVSSASSEYGESVSVTSSSTSPSTTVGPVPLPEVMSTDCTPSMPATVDSTAALLSSGTRT